MAGRWFNTLRLSGGDLHAAAADKISDNGVVVCSKRRKESAVGVVVFLQTPMFGFDVSQRLILFSNLFTLNPSIQTVEGVSEAPD